MKKLKETLFLFILNLVVITPFQKSFAGQACSKDVVCVDAVQKENTIAFSVKNLQTAEITITFEFEEFEKLTATMSFPYTATYPGLKTTNAFTLAISDPQAWKYKYTYYWVWGTLQAKHDDSYMYSLPYASGQSYVVIRGSNANSSTSGDEQYAIEWAMPEGSPVHAARSGTVVGVKDTNTTGGSGEEYRDYTNYIMIKHADGTIGEYDHLQAHGAKIQVGHHVQVGQLIGLSGNTGDSSAPNLWFVVYKPLDGKRLQSFPIRFLTREGLAVILEQGESYTAF